MPSEDEMLHQVAGLEPVDAKKLLAVFEAEAIPFEVESDFSELTRPGRTVEMNFGMYPAGARLLVFVPASFVSRAETIVQRLFPV